MANYYEYLQPQQSPHASPFITINKVITGVDQLIVKALPFEDQNLTPALWKIESVRFDVATDATVANRYVAVATTRVGITKNWDYLTNTNAITASSNVVMVIGRWVVFGNVTPGSLGAIYAGVNENWGIFDSAGDFAKFWFVTNGQAGDTLTINVVFRSLNRELVIVPKDSVDYPGVQLSPVQPCGTIWGC